MNTSLTEKQIEDYRRDGFTAHRGLLSAEEVATLKEAMLDVIASMGRKKVVGGNEDIKEGDSYYDKVFTQRLNLWRASDTVKHFMLNSGIGEMLRKLEGVDFRVWHDQALIKEPFGNPTAWHLDNPYWSFHSRNAISIWIALEPATLENGCMCFLIYAFDRNLKLRMKVDCSAYPCGALHEPHWIYAHPPERPHGNLCGGPEESPLGRSEWSRRVPAHGERRLGHPLEHRRL